MWPRLRCDMGNLCMILTSRDEREVKFEPRTERMRFTDFSYREDDVTDVSSVRSSPAAFKAVEDPVVKKLMARKRVIMDSDEEDEEDGLGSPGPPQRGGAVDLTADVDGDDWEMTDNPSRRSPVSLLDDSPAPRQRLKRSKMSIGDSLVDTPSSRLSFLDDTPTPNKKRTGAASRIRRGVVSGHTRVSASTIDASASESEEGSDGETEESSEESSSSSDDDDDDDDDDDGNRRANEGGGKGKAEGTADENAFDWEGLNFMDGADTYGEGGRMKGLAQNIMNKCTKLSRVLTTAISSWHQADAVKTKAAAKEAASSSSSSSSSSSGAAADSCKAIESGCVALTSIQSSNSEILKASDFTDMCPGLVLKDYQLVGVNWLKLLHVNKVNGVLADDMGLGKTVQTIAFLSWLKSRQMFLNKRGRVHLICVPASTLNNWNNELSRFSTLQVIMYHGSQRERLGLRQEIRERADDGSLDVVLCTYTIFERDSGRDDRIFLCNLRFEYLVLDEAHCIKNSNSSRYLNLKRLNNKHRLLLSGTPVQNDVKELLSMLTFLMPKVFGTSNVDVLLEMLGLAGLSGKDSSERSGDAVHDRMIGKLRRMLAPFVLRRLKVDVLTQLVDKTTEVIQVDMTDFQKDVYNNILFSAAERKKQKAEEAVSDFVIGFDLLPETKRRSKGPSPPTVKLEGGDGHAIDLTGDGGGGSGAGSSTVATAVPSTSASASTKVEREFTSGEARSLFTALRKAANHPLLLRVRFKDEKQLDLIADVAMTHCHFGNQCDRQRVRDELDKMSDVDLHYLCQEYKQLEHLCLSADVLYDSPKMRQLRNLLPKLQAGDHRMLIFSQWTRLLDLLELLMTDLKMPFLRLDGSTPVKERQEMIDRFSSAAAADKTNAGYLPVFLLSTKAGGLGINLTAADTVILHDLDFNPENDRQAEDRCHRIGQTRPVTVYKLIAAETVDHAIFAMGERKSIINKAVLQDARGRKPVGGAAAAAAAAAAGDAGKENRAVTSVADGAGDIGLFLREALAKARR